MNKKNNDEFLQDMQKNNIIKIKPLEEYKGNYIKIKFKCDKGHEFYFYPHNILKGIGCPYCANKKIIEDENSLWATRPDLRIYIPEESIQFAKNVSQGSKKEILLICPNCNKKRTMAINDFTYQGFNCHFCKNSVSLPNRFIRLLLFNLKEKINELIFEYKINYNNTTYYYDASFYYNGIHYFIEMDGDYHYRDKQTKERDEIKNKYAKENKIKLIRISCKHLKNVEKNINNIKENILNSELNQIFDLINFDWENFFLKLKCTNELVDFSKFIKLNNKKLSSGELLHIFKIDRHNLEEKIKKAIELGLIEKDSIIFSKGEKRRLIGYKNNIELGIFRSLSDFAEYIQKNYEQNKKINSIKHYFYKNRNNYGYTYKLITKEEYYNILEHNLVIPENNLFIINYYDSNK